MGTAAKGSNSSTFNLAVQRLKKISLVIGSDTSLKFPSFIERALNRLDEGPSNIRFKISRGVKTVVSTHGSLTQYIILNSHISTQLDCRPAF